MESPLPSDQSPRLPAGDPNPPPTGDAVSLPAAAVSFTQRVLAEAVRRHEEALGHPLADPQAEAAARASGGDLEQRIVVRAQALAIAPALQTALKQLHGATRVVIAAGLILALMAGAAAAQVALGSPTAEPVNFFWALGSLLGVPTLTLAAWLILMLAGSGVMSAGSLGGMALAVGRRFDRWLHKGPLPLAVVQASAAVFARGAIGRWTLSAISHALWLTLLTGCLLLTLLILSAKQVNFAWETTILSDRAYVTLTRALGAVPAALGFNTPDAQQIAASHWTGTGALPGEAREAWAGLLTGCLVIYGLLPRALLLLLCLAARWRALARFRLDVTEPGYARLQARLLPVANPLGVVDADRGTDAAPTAAPPLLAIRTEGPVAVLGLEIDIPESGWPPPIAGVDWLDLGLVDSRSDRQRALAQLAPAEPRLILAVCSLASTPDRGLGTFIRELQQSTRTPVALALTDGQRLRARGHTERVGQRVEDWRRLAAAAGVPPERVVEADLNHLTPASRGQLAGLMGGGNPPALPARRLEAAFNLIVTHVRRWDRPPGVGEQAELQRAIARLYQEAGQSWREVLRTGAATGSQRLEQLQTGAARMVELLPERLRQNRRWLAAGALAGALACVAAATLAAPAAIAALPAWAGLGAAVAAALPPLTTETPAARTDFDLAETVASAALFALVLELQGRGETAITRLIDQVAGADEPPVMADAESAQAWLDALRHRLDQALALENAP